MLIQTENDTSPASLCGAGGEPMLLEGVCLTGEAHGTVFEATIEQRFYNPSDRHVELTYTFPLPWRAVLLGVDVLLGDTRLTGCVVGNTQATSDYEEALSEGNAAILLEKNLDDSYSLSLGNLAPNERCVITLRYAQMLSVEQGSVRLMIPTVIAPRYGDPVRQGGLQPHQVIEHSLTADYPFELSLSVYGELAQARITSPSHSLSIRPSVNNGICSVAVGLAQQAALDRDFVLVLDQLAQNSLAFRAPDQRRENQQALMASFCPSLPAAKALPVAVKILVDCSGSMAGDSIFSAQRALQAIVAELGADDQFALSRFGSTVEHRSRGLWKVTTATRNTASQWVAALAADLGGTEMEGALSSTFALSHSGPCDVLLLTDGEIHGIDTTLKTAQKSGHRLFIVAIGSSPAGSHLRRLAATTGGACEFVAPGEGVAPAIVRMFARLRSACLSEVQLRWPEGVQPFWVSDLSTALFEGDSVSVAAWLPIGVTGTLQLLAKSGPEQPLGVIGEVALKSRDDGTAYSGADTLPRLVAEACYQQWQQHPERSEAAEQLAVQYQLITEQTSYVLIHERAEADKATEMPEPHAVRQMLPAGWGGLGTVVASPVVLHSRCHLMTLEPGLCWDDYPAIDSQDGHAAEEDSDKVMSLEALRERLDELLVFEWPTSDEQLLALGVAEELIEWLKNAVDGGIPEELRIQAFLIVVNQLSEAQVQNCHADACWWESTVVLEALEKLVARISLP